MRLAAGAPVVGPRPGQAEARAALGWGWAELDLRGVVSIIAAGNARSVRVAKKLGMQWRGPDRVHPGTGRRVHVYERGRP